MIAMIFEFWIDPDAPEIYEEYQRESSALRESLSEVDGFRSVERFESSSEPGKFVAIGFFDSAAAVAAWRNRAEHRRAQALGRSRYFTGYRLRMAEVVRDYRSEDRDEAPADSCAAHDGAAARP